MKVQINSKGVMSILSESEWEDKIIKLFYDENKSNEIGSTIQFCNSSKK